MEAKAKVSNLVENRIKAIQAKLGLDLENLSSEERVEVCKQIAACCLREIPNDQPMGTNLHDAMSPFLCNIAFEGVLLRKNEKTTEVFLARRPADDSVVAWRNKLHVPGVLLFNWEMAKLDTDLTSAAERLSKKEYGGLISSWRLVGDKMFQAKRGPARCLIHLIECKEDPAKYKLGDWYDVNNLPPDVISAHCDAILPEALKAFLRGK